MISYIVDGNLLTSTAHTLVNTVNCDGYMGKGLALQFKEQYPQCFKGYRAWCDAGKLRPGMVQACTAYEPAHLILNVATKGGTWKDSRIEWVESILRSLVAGWTPAVGSIAISKLGCGNGGLLWSDVGPLMVSYFSRIDAADVFIYVGKDDQQY